MQLIHYATPQQNLELFSKVASVLNPGGTFVIADQLTGRAPVPTVKAFVRLLDFNYFVALGGAVYSLADITHWLLETGFSKPKKLSLRSAPGQYLLIAQRI